ncbi:MAG: bifunctional hydroxymethylpyrimidine kinase/phosphomethylpyrimidine kinase [Chloroflexi bacterium]|nr:bifunctional hydroxymethylpyrimidine kinase/phosphomethylpyrimidine kinase [Chloroflexota bacterium]
MTAAWAECLLNGFQGRKILVVGDLVLDEYLLGRASRLSREAPVPVLELVERSWRPGAATNPAANIAALGGQAVMVGAIGDDAPGRQLRLELGRAGVDGAGLVIQPDRGTATKTRILATHAAAHPQQVARIDDLPREPLSEASERALCERIAALLPACDAVLVSNYRGGVVTTDVVRCIVEGAARQGVPTCVDTQGDLSAFGGFTLVKANQPDAEAALATVLRAELDFQEAGARLARELGSRHVVITRGGDGMSVVAADGTHTHLEPANRTEVWDVTGAGDTVIAVLALGLACGADPIDAARLANAAAGLVVRRIGVASVTPDELLAATTTSPLSRS